MTLLNRLLRFAKSPQGRRAMSQAGRYARSPQGRAHLDAVRRQITSRRWSRPR
jgi:hypothetical protein